MEANGGSGTPLLHTVKRSPQTPFNRVFAMEANGGTPLLHTVKRSPQTPFNRVFAAIYACAIALLLYYHIRTLLFSTSSVLSFSISLVFLAADLVLAFQWINTQTFRMCPVYRTEYVDNLERVTNRADFPALDVFICTADPYKEPPISVVNTALSVMAYDYPRDKVSVYVSDDGGSALTLFALMEAAKFATHWLPFCEKNKLQDRCPDAYFRSTHCSSSDNDSHMIKMMYESMKVKIETTMERGKVDDEYINGDQEHEAFNKWTHDFTRQDHPAVIQVLSDSSKDKDMTGNSIPNLIYVSRQKSKTSPHHFKAGALNVLLRVSATMTNAPLILTLDCDSYSNHPRTPLRVLCYVCDPAVRPTLAFVQFPQIFYGLNKNDIYAGEHKRLYQIHPKGCDGLLGPNYLGSGCFFLRRAFFGGPSSLIAPEIPELHPNHVVDKSVQAQSTSALTHEVASCNYESKTNWGSKIGFRYGSLSEDFFTGFQMHCEGWRSIFCHPERAAYYGDSPITLVDVLNQQKRWSIGLLQVCLCRYSPVTYGVRALGPLMGLSYAQSTFWASWSIPVTIYALLPQLSLLNRIYIFPKATEPWFFLYLFLFLGAYGQDFLDFLVAGGTVKQWWNDQRFWHIKALTSFLFGSIEFWLKFIGISAFGFNVTSKILDSKQRKRYEGGVFEFGVHSPMFVVLTLVAIVNLLAFVQGLVEIVVRGNNLEDFFVQMFITGFAVVNCWPIYEAMALRKDSGRMARKTIAGAILLACAFLGAASLIFG